MTRRRPHAGAVLVVVSVLVGAPVAHAAAPAPAPPSVTAPSAIVMEASTGAVAYAKAADVARPIASTTKLMTALLTLEHGDLDRTLRASRYRPLPIESQLHLRPGERLTARDLLRGMLIESANDAAATLAEGVDGSRRAFVVAMNARAQELGLTHTHYVDPIGIGAGNVSSARDLARLTRVLRRYPFFRRVVARPEVVLHSGAYRRTLANRNDLVSDPLVDGVKTGHTLRAGYVLVGSGRRGRGAHGLHVISVVLGTASESTRDLDTLALLRWGVSRFRVITPVRRGDTITSVPIRARRGAELPLVAGRSVRRVVPRGAKLKVRIVGLPRDVGGPIAAGERVATLDVRAAGRSVARVPLVASAAVPAASVIQRTKDSLTRPLTVGLAIAALLGSVLLVRLASERGARRARKEPGVA